MYNPNTAIDSLDFETTEWEPHTQADRRQEYEADLPPAVRFILEVGTHLSELRSMRLEQEEAR
jgi:hypothetical protein